MSRCKKWIAMFATVAMAMPAVAQEKPAAEKEKDPKMAVRANQVRGDEITPAQQAAVERGWLTSHRSRPATAALVEDMDRPPGTRELPRWADWRSWPPGICRAAANMATT